MQNGCTPRRAAQLREWDEPVPALDGLTPRQAKSPETKAKLDLLVRDIEYMETRVPEAKRYDMNRVRESSGSIPDLATEQALGES